MDDVVLLERREAIAIVSLNLPAKRHALTTELRASLRSTMQSVLGEDKIRIVVLTGTAGAFCSGGDITRMGASDPIAARPRLTGTHDIIRMIANGPKPVVAAVEGPAYGAGLAFAAACDMVVATPASTFCASFVRLGLMPDGGLLWSLPQRVGIGAAKRMLFQCKVVDGRQAHSIGLVDELVENGTALEAAIRHAECMASMAPLPMAIMKSVYANGLASLEATFHLELEHQIDLFQSLDHAEGRDAFFAKRKAYFRGE